MKITRNGRLGIAAVVAVALAAAGAAFAATKIHTTSSTPGGGRFGFGGPPPGYSFGGRGFGRDDGDRRRGGPRALAAASSYLDLSPDALFAQLRAGKTLAQIANATGGKSADGLIAAMMKAEEQELADAVANGRLTQTQADELTQRLKDRITALVNGGFGRFPGPPRSFPRPPQGAPPNRI